MYCVTHCVDIGETTCTSRAIRHVSLLAARQHVAQLVFAEVVGDVTHVQPVPFMLVASERRSCTSFPRALTSRERTVFTGTSRMVATSS